TRSVDRTHPNMTGAGASRLPPRFPICQTRLADADPFGIRPVDGNALLSIVRYPVIGRIGRGGPDLSGAERVQNSCRGRPDCGILKSGDVVEIKSNGQIGGESSAGRRLGPFPPHPLVVAGHLEGWRSIWVVEAYPG